jgi:hypothetical protein
MNQQESVDDIMDEAVGMLIRLGVPFVRAKSRMKSRPILGGVFGQGAYRLYSWVHEVNGLDAVAHYVVHEESHAVLALDDNKAEALRIARMQVALANPVRLSRLLARVGAGIRDGLAKVEAAEALARASSSARVELEPAPKRIPKRRQKIFEASDGKCHYCATALTLDGRWHIEHKMPRALLGGSEQHNLVASCVTCNLKKSDKTDLEFQAQLKGSAA